MVYRAQSPPISMLAAMALSLSAVVLAAPNGELPSLSPLPDGWTSGPTARADITYLQASGSINLRTGQVHRNLTLQALVHIPNDLDAVGVAYQLELSDVTDAQGNDLLDFWRSSGQAMLIRRQYNNLTRRSPSDAKLQVNVSASVSGLPEIPSRFKTIRGAAYVLVASNRVVTDLEPLRPGGLIELTPDMAIQILRTHREGSTYEVTFAFESEQNAPFFNPNMSPPFIAEIRLLDSDGKLQIRSNWNPMRQQLVEGMYFGEYKISFSLPPDREPMALRIETVTRIKEVAVPFELHDVEMPMKSAR